MPVQQTPSRSDSLSSPSVATLPGCAGGTPPPPRARRPRCRCAFRIPHSAFHKAVALCFPLAFVLLVLLPLFSYFFGFAWSPLETLTRTFSSREEIGRLAGILGRTLAIAVGGATLSLILGILAFAAIHSTPRRARNGLWALAAAPLLIPEHFSAIGWIQTAGKAGWLTAAAQRCGIPEEWAPTLLYSLPGCVFVLALHFYPIAMAMVWLGSRTTGAAAVESAATLMPPGRVWVGLLVGWLRPWLAAGWLIVFILCLLDYSVPELLRRHVFSVEIMTAYGVYYDPPRAMGLSLPLVAIGLLAAAALGRLLVRFDWPVFARRGGEWPRLALRWRALFLALGTAVVLAAAGVPAGNFLGRADGWESYRDVLKSSAAQAATSLLSSALAALATAILAVGLALVGLTARYGIASDEDASVGTWSKRFASLYERSMFCLMLAMFALPASVIGMAHIAFWNDPAFGGIKQAFYDSGWMFPLGALTLFLPIAYVTLWARLRQDSRILIDLERMDGDRSLRRRFVLSGPILFGPALLAAVVVFILAMQELHAAVLLLAPGQETLSVRAFTLLHYAPDRLVAAFCLASLATLALGAGGIVGIAAVLRLGLKRWMPYCAFD